MPTKWAGTCLPPASAVPAEEAVPAQLLITWLTNASQWELPHGDLPADPRVGNTHHVGADEQMQMHGGADAFAEGWKGHILTACGPLRDCAWVGLCAWQTS